MTRLKQVWSAGGAAIGLWMTSDSSAVAETVGGLDYDYVNIDLQHGYLGDDGFVGVMRALEVGRVTASADATILCRVPWNEPGVIGQVLDAGAMGVIIPMVNSAEQAERAVAACRYAPEGGRSYGPIRALRVNGSDYRATANQRVACIPMIETVDAVSNLDEILDVPGIDAVYVGPADLSLTLGLPPQGDHDDDSFDDALAKVVAACERRGIVPGIHANPQIVSKRLDQGFRMVTATSDLQALVVGAELARSAGRRGPTGGSEPSLY